MEIDEVIYIGLDGIIDHDFETFLDAISDAAIEHAGIEGVVTNIGYSIVDVADPLTLRIRVTGIVEEY